MEEILESFKNYMIIEGKSSNTIKSYLLNIKEYLIWFQNTYGIIFKRLYRENILEYKSYLINIKNIKGIH